MKLLTKLVPLALLASSITCAAPNQHQTELTQQELEEMAGESSLGRANKAAVVVSQLPQPPQLTSETWLLPALTQDSGQPHYPYLPDEDRGQSRSIGDVVDGYLVNAARLPLPHPHLVVLPIQFQRRLLYTTDEMVELITDAANHVARSFEGAVVHLGNFSAEGGGDIPYSVSHNSGRDADIAFFVNDAEGNPAILPDLLPLDDEGKFIGAPDTPYEGHAYFFDPARNWAFIEGLLLSDAAAIQFVFVSNPLRNLLLEYARQSNADPKLIARARTILVQPGGALPHDDHFHIRTYCSEIDMRSGCKDTGRITSEFRSFNKARNQTIARAQKLLKNPDPAVRTTAIQRLTVMQAHNTGREIAKYLDDPDPRVRAASARALAKFAGNHAQTYTRALARQLTNEQHPHVVAEILGALGSLGGSTASDALRQFLHQPQPVSLLDTLFFDARTIAAGALVALEDTRTIPALITMLNDDNADLRTQTARALQMLTNHQFGTNWHADDAETRQQHINAWQSWYETHKTMTRDQWIALGFQQAGFDIPRLTFEFVWEICRAISHEDHLSYNAQRTLMRLTNRQPNSLAWSKEDASFYWRRWFERRTAQYGTPPIPIELSTLQPETPY